MTKQERLREIGLLIKIERIRKGLSQEKLAELVDISTHYVSMIESGKVCFSFLIFIDIANVLNIDLVKFSKI